MPAGVGESATLKIELLDHRMNPLADYSGEKAAIVRGSGFQIPVSFNGRPKLENLPDRVRVRAIFEGEKRTEIRFSAIYLR